MRFTITLYLSDFVDTPPLGALLYVGFVNFLAGILALKLIHDATEMLEGEGHKGERPVGSLRSLRVQELLRIFLWKIQGNSRNWSG